MAESPDKSCGLCGAFTQYAVHPTHGFVGACARGMISYPVPASAICGEYRARGTAHELVPLTKTRKAAPREPAAGSVIVRRPPLPEEIDLDMDIATFRTVLQEVLREELGVGEARIQPRFQGGELILKPGKEGTAEKRIPVETFFHKIVMIRDKLRVLEQRVNGHTGLTDEDKVTMQQYITGCYGTLTTFNVLFADPADGFKGAAPKD
jgi:hypothetical protein